MKREEKKGENARKKEESEKGKKGGKNKERGKEQEKIGSTAGAESIATLSEKTAGTKFEISTLRNMIETSGFFHCTHIAAAI
jgi:hypothetical protein